MKYITLPRSTFSDRKYIYGEAFIAEESIKVAYSFYKNTVSLMYDRVFDKTSAFFSQTLKNTSE